MKSARFGTVLILALGLLTLFTDANTDSPTREVRTLCGTDALTEQRLIRTHRRNLKRLSKLRERNALPAGIPFDRIIDDIVVLDDDGTLVDPSAGLETDSLEILTGFQRIVWNESRSSGESLSWPRPCSREKTTFLAEKFRRQLFREPINVAPWGLGSFGLVIQAGSTSRMVFIIEPQRSRYRKPLSYLSSKTSLWSRGILPLISMDFASIYSHRSA